MVKEDNGRTTKRISTSSKDYYKKNRERILVANKIWRDSNRDKRRASKKRYYQKHKDKWREMNNRRTRERYAKKKAEGGIIKKGIGIRNRLLNVLGADCARCGYNDFRALEIDHVNGNGRKEMTSFGKPDKMYLFYYRNPIIAKQKLQVLCANCNMIKRYELKQYGNGKRSESFSLIEDVQLIQ